MSRGVQQFAGAYALAVVRPNSPQLRIARSLLPGAQGRSFALPVSLTHPDGLTSDIVEAVLAQFRRSWRDCARLAPLLRGRTDEETFRSVWQFARQQITYLLDRPPGNQYIKTPRAVLMSGTADCKGLATLQNALLACLGYQPAFKFAGYVPSGQFTHVYSQVADRAGTTYVLDACLPAFGMEKKTETSRVIPALATT
jgi:hypothetical protein